MCEVITSNKQQQNKDNDQPNTMASILSGYNVRAHCGPLLEVTCLHRLTQMLVKRNVSNWVRHFTACRRTLY